MSKKVKILFVIVAIASGSLLALQVRSFRKIELLVQRSQAGDVLAELRTFQVANEQLRENITAEEKALENINAAISKTAIEDQIDRLRIFSGEEAVSGEGIEMTISAAVEEFWLSDLIAQVVSVGAEAVAMNDIRLLPETAGFRTINKGIKMRNYYLNPPFKMTVIGPKEELHRVLAQHGGIIDRMKSVNPNLTVLLAKRDSVTMPPIRPIN